MIYTTEHFPIKLGYWYIISFGDFRNITLYPVYFINKVCAKRALYKTFSHVQRGKYKAVSGRKLKVYELKYKIKLGRLAKFTKYDFNPEWTDQQKKTRRTIIRRRLRRMGMLIPKKHKIFFKDNVKPNVLVKNTQKVAMSPYTDAKAFRLERKPKHFFYVIIDKKRVDIKGIAFKVDSIKYNSKTGEYKRKLLNINNQDVIIPHLLSEVFAQALNKGNYEQFKEYCRGEGVRIYKEKSKNFLQGMV